MLERTKKICGATVAIYLAVSCATVPDDTSKEFHAAKATLDRADDENVMELFPETIKTADNELDLLDCGVAQAFKPRHDFLYEVFGEAGRHTRSSVGITSVFENIPIEIEMIVEVTRGRAATQTRASTKAVSTKRRTRATS